MAAKALIIELMSQTAWNIELFALRHRTLLLGRLYS